MDDLTSPSKIASIVVSVLKTHADCDDVSEIIMSPGNESMPSPGAALFGLDRIMTTGKKNLPLTKAGKISKVRRTNYARMRKKDSPLYKGNENPWEYVKWLKMIKRPEISNPATYSGKWFRRKFRIPFPVFQRLVQMCRDTQEPVFCYNERCVGGQFSTPLELKILSVLRMVAAGLWYEDAAEQSQYMSEPTIRSFFKSFMRIFRQYYEKECIHPLEGDEFIRSNKVYSALGLPGAVGSIDVTFVGPWEGCSSNLKNVMKGDKGQGLLYEVIVDHSGKIISVEGGYYGSINDKCSVKYSKFINMLQNNELYQEYCYIFRTGLGHDDIMKLKTFYVISDGGYLNWPSMMTGFAPSSESIKYKFTDWMASVRKDVECTFGILKQRFRWLKCPIRLFDKNDVDNVFVFCCIVHNMILRHDGLDAAWERNIDWEKLDPNAPDTEDEQVPTLEETPLPQVSLIDEQSNALFIDEIVMQSMTEPSTAACFTTMQRLSANHLHYTYRRGELKWPKHRRHIPSADNIQPRRLFPMCTDDV
jgi:hypothetical protein